MSCMYVLSSESNRSQVTATDIAKCEPVLIAGVRNHNDVKKKYEEISFDAFDKYSKSEHQVYKKVCSDIFQVKCSLGISAMLYNFSYLL